MKFKDIREFIAFLESKGELIRIKAPVSCDLEITEITDRVVKRGGPALLFENVEGHNMPVLINAYGSTQRTSWALGVEHLDELGDRIRKLLGLVQGPPPSFMGKVRTLVDLVKMAGYQPKLVRSAPCQQVVLTGQDADLNRIPILKCWPMDAGRFITLPLVITKDPETGVRNVGTYRMQVYDGQTAGMHWQTHKVGTHHERVALERGQERMEVAVALGGDPATLWTGSAPLPPDLDELVMAGFLREEGVEVVKVDGIILTVARPSDSQLPMPEAPAQ